MLVKFFTNIINSLQGITYDNSLTEGVPKSWKFSWKKDISTLSELWYDKGKRGGYMIKKIDWKTVEMPEQIEKFVIEKTLTDIEIEYIKEGHRPQEMEDKWFMYFEDKKLFIHRSWTGYCIYIIDLSEHGKLNVTVNRNPEQYKEDNVENDKIMVNILINQLIQQNGENAKLMKMYLARKNKKDGFSAN